MRHRMRGRHLSRTSSHRRAMRRNLACNLFVRERIQTTPEKAKEVKAFVERLISLARTSSVANFRRALALLDDRFVVRKLFREIGPRYVDRPGGYTRILRLDITQNRLGDNARQVLFELVKSDEAPAKEELQKKAKVRDRLRSLEGEGKAEGETAAQPAPAEKAEGGEAK